jgi:Flp pilus assembly protein TadG
MVTGWFTILRAPLWRPFRRMAGDTRGVSAVEFALILPIMLTLYITGNELSHALTLSRKVTHVTSTVGDLVTQAKTISAADMTSILNVAASLMTPYSTTPLKIVVSGITIDSSNVARVTWSSALNEVPLVVNKVVTSMLPATVKAPSTFLITAQVHYLYTPSIGYNITGSFDLHDQFYLRPRYSDTITGP